MRGRARCGALDEDRWHELGDIRAGQAGLARNVDALDARVLGQRVDDLRHLRRVASSRSTVAVPLLIEMGAGSPSAMSDAAATARVP